jgi:hypothetical protein
MHEPKAGGKTEERKERKKKYLGYIDNILVI